MSDKANELLSKLISEYERTGENEFDATAYAPSCIRELEEYGDITVKKIGIYDAISLTFKK